VKQLFLFILSYLFIGNPIVAQVLTAEDSLAAGIVSNDRQTVISGYGELSASADLKQQTAEATLRRTVLFIGHRFRRGITLFTEMEIENAVVSGNSGLNLSVGELAMEQVLLKFDLNDRCYLVGGLFIPRIGIINENHLPTTFNGTDRPLVEQLIIPSTWRSIGIGLYGETRSIQGLYYSLSLTNGLNSAGFSNGSGIREGRQMGNSSGRGLGVTGSLLYYTGDFRFQVSGFAGGSTAMEKRVADSLQLTSGAFAQPVYLGEANGQYRSNGFSAKILFAYVAIPSAASINRAFANNTPSSLIGSYAELSYNLLEKSTASQKSLIAFARAEYLNLNQTTPENGIRNDANRKLFLMAGLTFKPIPGIAVKADYAHRLTGLQNPALIVSPFPQQVPYYHSKGFINLGIAYNF